MGRQTGRRRRGDEYKRKGEGSGCEVSFFPFFVFFFEDPEDKSFSFIWVIRGSPARFLPFGGLRVPSGWYQSHSGPACSAERVQIQHDL